MSHFGADLKSGTLRKHLSAIDALYRSAERQIGDDCLDRLLFELDVPLIEGVASGFFNEERNRSIQYGIDTSQRWNSANRFLFEYVQLGIGVEKDAPGSNQLVHLFSVPIAECDLGRQQVSIQQCVDEA
ncbi:MAG: hypothetical protein AAGF82_03835 [Pseudomonadota bacterium]